MTSGSARASRWARMASASAMPSMSGICMSRMATSKGSPRRIHSSASAPWAALRARIPQFCACSVRMRRFVSLSSTIRMRRPESEGCALRCQIRAWVGTEAAVIVKEKVEPSPGTLSTHIVPPINSASRFEMARPRPVPPYIRVVEASTWLKDLKRRSIRSGGMPMPVSRTAKRTACRRSAAALAETETTTSPLAVNLIALPIRLTSTCRRRVTSPTSVLGTPSSIR